MAKGISDSKTDGASDNTTKGTNYSISTGETIGDSLALTSERIDKRAERMQKHLSEDLIERFLRGRSKGMFRTAVYVTANFKATFDRLARGVLSIYQGNQSSITPLRITPLKERVASLGDLLRIRYLHGNSVGHSRDSALAHSMPIFAHDTLAGATWLNTNELALLTGLPSQELPGIKIRKSVDFAVNTKNKGNSACVHLGKIIQHGRILKHKQVDLPLAELNNNKLVVKAQENKITTEQQLKLDAEYILSDELLKVVEPLPDIIHRIKGDPEWMKAIKKKAEENKLSVDEQVQKDAEWLFEQNKINYGK